MLAGVVTAALFAAASAASTRAPPQPQDKIDHFVVLYMENRPFDHIFGCMSNAEGLHPDADGLMGNEKLWIDPSDHAKGYVNVTCGTAKQICPSGPGFDLWAGHFKPGAQAAEYPYDAQSNDYAYQRGAHGVAINMFSGDQLPVKRNILQEYAIFNNFYTAVPSASYPNHQMSQSATSCSVDENIVDWSKCGGNQTMFPQATIFDALDANGNTFAIYYNDTPNSADMFMEGVYRHKANILPDKDFYTRAAAGTLPQYSWVMPGIDPRNGQSNSDHPCHDLRLGERLVKDVYEALRAGPKWGKTLFVVAYDDAGGFYDHVVPPFENVPASDSPCNEGRKGCPHAFDFKRLGLRSTAYAMSPWVGKKALIKTPQKPPQKGSQFNLVSLVATARVLFGIPKPLNTRDAWSATLDEILLDTPRPDSDCPMHLVDALPPTNEPGTHGCEHPDAITRKQMRDVEALCHLTNSERPDVENMVHHELQGWIRNKWQQWFDQDE